MSRYALFGRSVSSSPSPRIHAAFARQTGIAMEYTAIDVEPQALGAALEAFVAGGGRGANITVPHKEAAFARCARLSERARQAGAVNTLRLDQGQWYGDNTDGAGLVRDLTDRHGLDLRGRRTLLLGAGGAARGAMEPLLSLQPELLAIANRTAHRAVALAREFAELGPVVGCEFSKLEHRRFDLIVNATSASLHGDVPLVPIDVVDSKTTCYDMAYGAGDTAFVAWGKRLGAARAEQGWGMLVEQAAEAFQLWRGVQPDTGPVLKALRQRASTAARSPS
jgi:shikimate dehydrogenase